MQARAYLLGRLHLPTPSNDYPQVELGTELRLEIIDQLSMEPTSPS